MADLYEDEAGEGDRSLSALFPGLADRLETEARERVSKRSLVEDRWLRDIAQYEGRDDEQITDTLRSEGRSSATVNITRAKCNTFESKLFDMLFPTDDKNWGINPTPVPELDMEVSKLNGQVETLTEQANTIEDPEEAERLRGEADGLAQKLRELETVRQTARQHADLMSAEIEDNLVECEYAMHCRSVIHDATVAGTGILKGPIALNERVRSNWLKDDAGVYRLQNREDNEDRFVYQHTSYWNLFPDLSGRTFAAVQDWMERYIWRKRDLISFAKQPGVDKEAVRRLLRRGPTDQLPEYMLNVNSVVEEEEQYFGTDVYIVWEYRGPLEDDEMQELMRYLARREMDGEEEGSSDTKVEIDPLVQMDAVVWFCQGEILRVAINHMDDNAPIYNVFQIEKSTARLWGVGVPYLMRTQAAIVNDSWRNMLDNANLAAFPQVEVDLSVIQRADGGENRIEPFGMWERLASAGDKPGFIFHQIPVHQEHFGAIIQMAMQFTDQETNISVLASGEQGSVSRTAGGMALLMNSVNVVFRRVVKNFDDGITSPVITRAYYYLMQFSEKEEIKGDYAVQARGSSVLLVREVQAQNLLLLASQLSLHPVLGAHFKMRELLKKLLQSMMIASDDVLKTQTEFEEDIAAQQQAEAEAPPDPEMVKLQLAQQTAQMDAETKIALARMNLEGALVEMAVKRNITLEQAAARLQEAREKIASDERMQAHEAAIDGRRALLGAPTGGGHF